MQIIWISIYILSLFLFIHITFLHETKTNAKLWNWKVSSIRLCTCTQTPKLLALSPPPKIFVICGLSIIIMLTLPFVAINAWLQLFNDNIMSTLHFILLRVRFSVAFCNINTAIRFYLNILYKQTNKYMNTSAEKSGCARDGKREEREHCLNE